MVQNNKYIYTKNFKEVMLNILKKKLIYNDLHDKRIVNAFKERVRLGGKVRRVF